MSNLVAIGLIFGLFTFAFALNTYILKNVEYWSEKIVTGARPRFSLHILDSAPARWAGGAFRRARPAPDTAASRSV